MKSDIRDEERREWVKVEHTVGEQGVGGLGMSGVGAGR